MKKIALISLGIGTVILGSQFICYVPQGYRMVMFHKLKGVLDQTYPEGLKFINPFLEVNIINMKVPILFKVTSSTFESEFELSTMDNEPVRIHLKTANKPDVNNLPNLYKRIGLDYEKKVLNSLLHESAK
jgi:regulator of protease activity HflC (stomatin/prohibitin superfamily)